MAFSFTNTGKAKNILKSGDFNVSEMEKGNAENFTLSEEQIRRIIAGNKNNAFEILNSAGKLLKDSLLTRSTGHKKHDFSSIQAASSLRLANLYRDIKALLKKTNNSKSVWDRLDISTQSAIQKSVSKKIKDIHKEFKKVYEGIKSDDGLNAQMNDFLKCNKSEQMKRINTTLDILHRSTLSRHIVFTDEQNCKKGTKMFDNEVSIALTPGIAPIGATMLGSIYLAMGIADATLLAASVPLLGFGVPLTALVVLTGVALHYKSDSLGAIANKRKHIKLQQSYEKAIQKLNDLEDYIEDKLTDAAKKTSKTITINDDMKTLISEFLEEQKADWIHYTTADRRQYDKSEKDKKNGTHIKGLIHVSDEKRSKIGRLKQGIANQWMKISTQ